MFICVHKIKIFRLETFFLCWGLTFYCASCSVVSTAGIKPLPAQNAKQFSSSGRQNDYPPFFHDITGEKCAEIVAKILRFCHFGNRRTLALREVIGAPNLWAVDWNHCYQFVSGWLEPLPWMKMKRKDHLFDTVYSNTFIGNKRTLHTVKLK